MCHTHHILGSKPSVSPIWNTNITWGQSLHTAICFDAAQKGAFICGLLLKLPVIELVHLAHMLTVRIKLIHHVERKSHRPLAEGLWGNEGLKWSHLLLGRLIHIFHEIGVEFCLHWMPGVPTIPNRWRWIHCEAQPLTWKAAVFFSTFSKKKQKLFNTSSIINHQNLRNEMRTFLKARPRHIGWLLLDSISKWMTRKTPRRIQTRCSAAASHPCEDQKRELSKHQGCCCHTAAWRPQSFCLWQSPISRWPSGCPSSEVPAVFGKLSRATLTHLDSQIGCSSLSIQAWHAQARVVSSLLRDRDACGMFEQIVKSHLPPGTLHTHPESTDWKFTVNLISPIIYAILKSSLADSVLYGPRLEQWTLQFQFAPSHRNVRPPRSMRRPASLD